MREQLSVLIVGAGPTGLMMAYQLARQGIHIRIIDKKSEPTLSSNATWIQARTLEIFDQLDLLHSFKRYGHICDTIYFHSDGKNLFSLSMKEINSIYPFILMLPQNKTENILEGALNQLGYHVERDIELLNIEQEGSIVISTLQDKMGKQDLFKSDWLIGCDGANSLVREKCGLQFPGDDLNEQFLVADATIDFSNIPKDQLHFFFDPGTVLTVFPLGDNRYRVSANMHLPYVRKLLTAPDVIDIVQERAHGKYYISNVKWVSPFWIHSKVVKQMRHGSIFLVGDAAHVLSPAGGQGMNMGIQDAYNLAWKLAFVIKGKADPSLLDTYHSERHPVARRTVNENEFYTKLVLFDDKFNTKLEEFKSDLSKRPKYWAKKIGNKISQLDVGYRKKNAIETTSSIETTLLKVGTRAPDILIQSATLYKYIDENKYNILIFTGINPVQHQVDKLIELRAKLENLKEDSIKIQLISIFPLENIQNVLLDSDKSAHKFYKVISPAVYIIRPDTYIAYRSSDINFEPIDNFFKLNLSKI